jgi:hypothetical protein
VHRAIKTAVGKEGNVTEEIIKQALPGLKIEVLEALEGDALAKLPRREK